MHMADALLSPAVGMTMWSAAAAVIAGSSRKLKKEMESQRVPLMGVLGAFIFAAQMINFTIPGTGSSGHLGGGLLLAVLLGPCAAFITLASVLTVQALFFADGGLLALGCNIFNLGFFPCFIAYPFVYRKILGNSATQGRILAAAVPAAVIGLQAGAFSVVLQTVLSGVSELPFRSFLVLMQSIHLGIGVVEGIVTAAVLAFICKARPELIKSGGMDDSFRRISLKAILLFFLSVALLTGGVLSRFASTNPDGLEWSLSRVSEGGEPVAAKRGIHGLLAEIQERTSFLPDYDFRKEDVGETGIAEGGTSLSGLLGGCLTLVLVLSIGFFLKRRCSSHSMGEPSDSQGT